MTFYAALNSARPYREAALAAVETIDPANHRADHGLAWAAPSVAALEAAAK
ncbi:hypothetical protein [Aquisediminimonas profunda]|uniref:hypothetical protein n=1 Tax=Aquisediminimonas profunda TaxID=1550733 RepID=UPI001C62F6B1|nr:hypothetical protein [Aquisediminimonas profunda]